MPVYACVWEERGGGGGEGVCGCILRLWAYAYVCICDSRDHQISLASQDKIKIKSCLFKQPQGSFCSCMFLQQHTMDLLIHLSHSPAK